MYFKEQIKDKTIKINLYVKYLLHDWNLKIIFQVILFYDDCCESTICCLCLKHSNFINGL